MKDEFSRRRGYNSPEKDISIREDAPYDMRGVVIDIAHRAGLTPSRLRGIVCEVLRKRPNPANWSEYPNIDGEVHDLVDACEWYRVYDIVEAICSYLAERGEGAEQFESEVNDYFRLEGIGWQLRNTKVEYRGSGEFEVQLHGTKELLADSGRTTSATEIGQAVADLSKRPTPDVTGAIQHGLAALECVARDVTGDDRATLGRILSDNPGLFPSPLDKAMEKLWGYASESGRHLREGRAPSYAEAELLVAMASAACKYLARAARPQDPK